MRNVILETRDGWRKKMAVPDGQRFVKVPVMSARDFYLDAETFTMDRDASYRLMTFDWDGRQVEDEITYDGDGYLLTVWEVWREV